MIETDPLVWLFWGLAVFAAIALGGLIWVAFLQFGIFAVVRVGGWILGVLVGVPILTYVFLVFFGDGN